MTTVLVHGSGPDHGSSSWPPSIEDLDDEVVVLTRPGFGASPSTDRNEVSWLADALSKFNREHLVAHSFGCALALAVCTRYPERCLGGLTLIEPPPTGNMMASTSAALQTHVQRVEHAYETPEDELATFALRFMRVFHPDWDVSETAFGSTEQAHFARLRMQPLPWALAVDERSVIDTRPVAVITGGWDPVFTEVGAYLASYGASWSELPGNRHAPQFVPGFPALVRRLRKKAE